MSKQKTEAPKDMHPADIQALFKKKGATLSGLSRHYGLAPNTLRYALKNENYPRGERIIAAFLEMKPEEIWPERYAKRNTKSDVFIGTPRVA